MLRQGQATLLTLLLLLAGCGRPPELYLPPEQRNPYELNPGKELSHYITMNMPGAEAHVAGGILPELHDGTWRWTLKRPTFLFRVPEAGGLKLRVDFTVPEITFQQTGPVSILVFVGGQRLARIEVAKPGQQIWEQAVPAELLDPDELTEVSLEIDKIWRSPDDGAQRGFILTEIGFVQ